MKANFTVIENNDQDFNFTDTKTGEPVELKRFQVKGVLYLGETPCMADFTLNRSDFNQADYPIGSKVEVDVSPTFSTKHKTMILQFNGKA